VVTYFGISRNTTYAAIRNGTLPSIRIAGQIRISRDALIAMLESQLAAEDIEGGK
jgi:excisionase family DNA binding protein